MGKTRKSKTALRTIVLATGTLVFVLFASMGGTIAWFMSQMDQQAEISQFQVMNRNAEIKSVRLIKFVYPDDGIGGLDYNRPNKDGDNNYYVKNYGYDFATHHEFGETVAGVWTPVEVMNLYDPLETEIQGTPLIDFNTNAIFEVTFSSSDFSGLTNLRTTGIKRPNIVPGENETLLTGCVDFDIYTPADLAETGTTSNPLYDEDEEAYTKYIPSYLTRELTAIEKVYYKIAYLSSLESGHANFYENEGERAITIGDEMNIDFQAPALNEPCEATVYINVNYAPSRLTQFRDAVTNDNRITALIDYYLSFLVS